MALVGGPDDVARRYQAPDGILPRMRLLAWGWEKPGDKLRSPSDSAWFSRRYQYPLWAPIATYVSQLVNAGQEPPAFQWDEDLAKGDAGELARSLPDAVQAMAVVSASPHPQWVIPAAERQLPIANPAPEPPATAPAPTIQPKKSGFPWWLLLLLLATDRRKR